MAGWRSPLAQTAANSAAAIVAAKVSKGTLNGDVDALLEEFDTIADHIFDRLDAVKVKDDEAYEADGGSKNRSAKTGGSKKSYSGSSKSGGKVTLADAKGMELKFGAFEGVALGDLVTFDTQTCEDDYGYGDGERDGSDYIKWLAGKNTKSDFVRMRARLVADDAGIEYEE